MIKRQIIAVKYISLAAFAAVCLNATAATRDKSNNQDNLNLSSSWLAPPPYTSDIAPWDTFGAGTSAKYATASGANIAGYSGTPVATAANVSDTTGALNYDVAAVGTLGAGASFNTLHYTGAAGTIAGVFQANGLLNAGAGELKLSGSATIGPNKEMVLISPDTTLTLRGAIGDNAAGPGLLGMRQGGVYHRCELFSSSARATSSAA